MPHLSPINWMILCLLFWLTLLIFISIIWWHQTPKFATYIRKSSKSNQYWPWKSTKQPYNAPKKSTTLPQKLSLSPNPTKLKNNHIEHIPTEEELKKVIELHDITTNSSQLKKEKKTKKPSSPNTPPKKGRKKS